MDILVILNYVYYIYVYINLYVYEFTDLKTNLRIKAILLNFFLGLI